MSYPSNFVAAAPVSAYRPTPLSLDGEDAVGGREVASRVSDVAKQTICFSVSEDPHALRALATRTAKLTRSEALEIVRISIEGSREVELPLYTLNHLPFFNASLAFNAKKQTLSSIRPGPARYELPFTEKAFEVWYQVCNGLEASTEMSYEDLKSLFQGADYLDDRRIAKEAFLNLAIHPDLTVEDMSLVLLLYEKYTDCKDFKSFLVYLQEKGCFGKEPCFYDRTEHTKLNDMLRMEHIVFRTKGKKELTQAYKWLEKAANTREKEALKLMLASHFQKVNSMTLWGWNSKLIPTIAQQDFEMARKIYFDWLKIAAEEGIYEAEILFGTETNSIAFLMKAAAHDEKKEAWKFILRYYSKPENFDPEQIAKAALKTNHLYTVFDVASHFLSGKNNFPRNPERALQLLSDFQPLINEESYDPEFIRNFLSISLNLIRKLAEDHTEKASQWLAILQNICKSQAKLCQNKYALFKHLKSGLRHEFGLDGAPKNITLAIESYKKITQYSQKSGYFEESYRGDQTDDFYHLFFLIGNFYQKGAEGLPQNLELASKYYLDAVLSTRCAKLNEINEKLKEMGDHQYAKKTIKKIKKLAILYATKDAIFKGFSSAIFEIKKSNIMQIKAIN